MKNLKEALQRVSLIEVKSFTKMTDKELIAWLKKNWTEEPVSPVFGRHLKNANKELLKRGLKFK